MTFIVTILLRRRCFVPHEQPNVWGVPQDLRTFSNDKQVAFGEQGDTGASNNTRSQFMA
jgi:hypothetical protein